MFFVRLVSRFLFFCSCCFFFSDIGYAGHEPAPSFLFPALSGQPGVPNKFKVIESNDIGKDFPWTIVQSRYHYFHDEQTDVALSDFFEGHTPFLMLGAEQGIDTERDVLLRVDDHCRKLNVENIRLPDSKKDSCIFS